VPAAKDVQNQTWFARQLPGQFAAAARKDLETVLRSEPHLGGSHSISRFFRAIGSWDHEFRTLAGVFSKLEVTHGFVSKTNCREKILPSICGGAATSRQILLVERLAYQRLDHRLAADVQLFGGSVQFFQHA
jgi:hypothetical protein